MIDDFLSVLLLVAAAMCSWRRHVIPLVGAAQHVLVLLSLLAVGVLVLSAGGVVGVAGGTQHCCFSFNQATRSMQGLAFVTGKIGRPPTLSFFRLSVVVCVCGCVRRLSVNECE